MNRKGFTFVELLSVMTLIALLGILAFPAISSMLKKSTENKYNTFLNNVFVATEAYIQDHSEDFQTLNEPGNTVYVYMGSLVANNYLKSSLVDPKTSQSIGNCSSGSCIVRNYTIQVTKTEIGTYNYKLINSTASYKTTIIDVARSLVYSANSCKTGNTYNDGCYLKGNQANNYVSFNGANWRIMGINSDNTVSLIYDGVKSQVTYNDLVTTYDNYYNNLGNFMRNTIKGIKSLDNDEYTIAGSSSSYLKINEAYWTDTESGANAYYINSSGTSTTQVKTATSGFRPVIKVSGVSAISDGNGTIDNKYQLIGDVTNDMNATINAGCEI